MQNVRMVGIQRFDHFNIRVSLMVVGIFGLITLVSYFNELAKSGLLFGNQDKRATAYVRFAGSLYSVAPKAAIIQQDGNLHQLDVGLIRVQNIIRSARNRTGAEKNEAINIALHIGKNASYEKSKNGTELKIYKFENTMPNYYLSMQIPWNESTVEKIGPANVTQLGNFLKMEERRQGKYINATLVLLYQHEPGGYMTRECVKEIAKENKLAYANMAMNMINRKEWELMPPEKKISFDLLYGGLTFGVCEGIDRPCLYFPMLLHPIDRVLVVYNSCKSHSNASYCNFEKINITDISLNDFIKAQSNTLFQKLLYYSKHCKLFGADEICLQGGSSSFIMKPEEKEFYLADVLNNLKGWFGVVGLVSNYKKSMKLYQDLLKYKFQGCLEGNSNIMKFVKTDFQQLQEVLASTEHLEMKRQLMNSTSILHWMGADLAIYNKFEEIFHQQYKISNLVRELNETYGFFLSSQHQSVTEKLANKKNKGSLIAQKLAQNRFKKSQTAAKKLMSRVKSSDVRGEGILV